MSGAPLHSVTVDVETLKRLITAASLSASVSRAEAEAKAAVDVELWRSPEVGQEQRVDVSTQVLALIAEAAELALASGEYLATADGGTGADTDTDTEADAAADDAAWAEAVRADLAQVATCIHGLPPAHGAER